jgi:hypothetical protein
MTSIAERYRRSFSTAASNTTRRKWTSRANSMR